MGGDRVGTAAPPGPLRVSVPREGPCPGGPPPASLRRLCAWVPAEGALNPEPPPPAPAGVSRRPVSPPPAAPWGQQLRCPSTAAGTGEAAPGGNAALSQSRVSGNCLPSKRRRRTTPAYVRTAGVPDRATTVPPPGYASRPYVEESVNQGDTLRIRRQVSLSRRRVSVCCRRTF